MMLSSNGSSQKHNVRSLPSAERAVHWSGVDMETYNNRTIRIPHRLRLDDQRVTYSFCPLYSIPENKPVCGFYQMLQNEPLWEPSSVTPNDHEAVLQENTEVSNTTNEYHSGILVPNSVVAPMERVWEGKPAATEANNNNNNKTETVVQSPAVSHEAGPQPVLVGKPQIPWHLQQWEGFLQALQGLDAAMQIVSEAALHVR